jgi:hypothetical protein
MRYSFTNCSLTALLAVSATLSAPTLAHAAPDALSPQTQPSAATPDSAAPATGASGPASASNTTPNPPKSSGWFARVDRAQATQPSWVTPIATVTPRLEEEVRYDQFWQNLGNGAKVDNYGGGKGLELIPTTTNEVIFNVPGYEVRTDHKPRSGFADDTVLLIKQRLISANAQNGDYIVTAFLGFQAPTGGQAFTNHSWVITPTIAGGKGFGQADVQATMGIGLPTDNVGVIGDALATNVAFQYHVATKFWPEFEVNDTYWSGGERSGKNQVLLTPGVVVGRFKLGGRFKANFGVGYQWAVAPSLVKDPALTPTLNNAWISTLRVSF